jgi:hypothetical protein
MIKKTILAALIVLTTSFASHASPEFIQSSAGSIRDYLPKIEIKSVHENHLFGTSGISGSIIERMQRNTNAMTEETMKKAKKECSKNKYYATDNLVINHSVFGDSLNVLTSMTVNIICFDKY